jgi:GNAT superfamily N-acetyltransferase
MIKLKDIVNEISLNTGDANTNTLWNFFKDAVEKNAFRKQKKYNQLYDGMSWASGRFSYDMLFSIDEIKKLTGNKRMKNWGEFDIRELDSATKKKVDKAVAEKYTFTPEMVKDLSGPVVASRGQFNLHAEKHGSEIYYRLGNKGAKYVYEYLIGVIKVEKTASSYRYTLKDAFDLKCFQIHWSNIVDEYKGQGFGKMIYEMVYEHVSSKGIALASDTILFSGSQKMWFQLMPSIANNFGIVMNDIYFPIAKEAMQSEGPSIGEKARYCVAIQNPPPLIRKISHNFKGLSFTAGSYGLMTCYGGVNDKLLSKAAKDAMEYDNFVYDDKTERWRKRKEKDFKGIDFTYVANLIEESTSIVNLYYKLKSYDIFKDYDSYNDSIPAAQAIVLSFENANLIVKETGGRLTWIAI